MIECGHLNVVSGIETRRTGIKAPVLSVFVIRSGRVTGHRGAFGGAELSLTVVDDLAIRVGTHELQPVAHTLRDDRLQAIVV